MKIAIWYNLPSGGGKRALYDQVQGLVHAGHQVEVWCPSTADQDYLPLSRLVKEHVLPLHWEPRARKGFFAELVDNYQNSASEIQAVATHAAQCAEQIRSGGFDLLLAHPCRVMLSPHIGRLLDLPKVLYLQEPNRPLYESLPQLPWVLPEYPGRPFGRTRIRSVAINLSGVQGLRLRVREELLNARAFDMILVNSYFSRESVLRAYGLNARVCYLGVDNTLFRPMAREVEDYVVGIGSFSPAKNQEFVLRALAQLPEPRPKLVWVGNYDQGGFMNRLGELARSLGVPFEPRLLVSDEALVGILNGAQAMVYAPRLEPFGYAPLEANACGVPVVAVAEGGLRETVVDGVNGLVTDPEPAAMAVAVQRLRSDPGLRQELGERGRLLVQQKWTREAAAGRLEHRLQSVLNAPHAPTGAHR